MQTPDEVAAHLHSTVLKHAKYSFLLGDRNARRKADELFLRYCTSHDPEVKVQAAEGLLHRAACAVVQKKKIVDGCKKFLCGAGFALGCILALIWAPTIFAVFFDALNWVLFGGLCLLAFAGAPKKSKKKSHP